MPKKCVHEGCKWPVFGGGYCKIHQGYRTDKKPKKIKQVSTKQTGRLKEYRVVRDKFMKENSSCARCGTTKELTLQHLSGRLGDLLTDTSNFMVLCLTCHIWATEFTKEAIEQGFARSRLKEKSDLL